MEWLVVMIVWKEQVYEEVLYRVPTKVWCLNALELRKSFLAQTDFEWKYKTYFECREVKKEK